MKKLTNKKQTKSIKHVYTIPKQLCDLLEGAKEIIMCLLNIFIFVSCYYILSTYNISNDNCELIIAYTDYIESKPVDQPNI
jgi:hypothetical protein